MNSMRESLNNMHDRNIQITSDEAVRFLSLSSFVNRNFSVKTDYAGNSKSRVHKNWLLSLFSCSMTR
jgi:hypothetical protein